MFRARWIVQLVAACALAQNPLAGENCDSVALTSVKEATEYLKSVGANDASTSCVNVAFKKIASAPPATAIPTLVTLLDYKRPLSEAEGRGIFLHGNSPNVLFPAVHELFGFGKSAEPYLLDSIARGTNDTNVKKDNASYTLVLIHHGNVAEVIEKLRFTIRATKDVQSRTRLQEAAEDALRLCDERSLLECRGAMNK